MRYAIEEYVGTHSPVEVAPRAETALELGKLAGHPLGSEPELELIIDGAVRQLKDEGLIAVTEKDDMTLVEYIEPLEAPEAKPMSYNHIDLFGESDALWDQAAEINKRLNQESDPDTVSSIRDELNAIYDQLGDVFNRP